TMADKIVVLNRGNIEQVGSPLELYHKPRNLFVAGFIGSPKMNLVKGQNAAALNAHTIGIRPEHLTISTTEGLWKGEAGVTEHLGSDTFVHVRTEAAGLMTVRASGETDIRAGETVYLTPDTARIHRFNENGVVK
ncbi:MAG: TOBE domain-containing protein, partial [Rhizobium sp.]|uniref:TOBE domain-containing protein n=1 Tax=Rhizobium sp. TaxID=391 RepID=UPI0030F0795E